MDAGAAEVGSTLDMIRYAARHIAPEMLALLLLEMAISFGLAVLVLSPGRLLLWHADTIDRAAVVAGTVGCTSLLLGLYRPRLFLRLRSLLLNTALGGAVAFPAAWAVTAALGMNTDWIVGPDRFWPTKILITWIAALFAVRIAFLVAVRSKLFVHRVAVLGPAGEVAGALTALRSARDGFFEVVPARRPAAPMPMRAAGIRIVLLPQAAFDAMTPADRAAYAHAGIAVEPEPVFWERRLRRIDIDHLTSSWFDRLDAKPGWTLEPALIRAGDIAISLGLLAFTLPLMLLVSLLVRLDSPGPVLYRQERVGLGGQTFTLLKFRSMKTNAEARGPAWAQRGDPRVTRVGWFMRRTRIDELPQLINVLRGEMGFIGPRPERPHFVEQLALLIPHYRERARVKPGLTGWAQVNYPYGASVEDARAKLSYDLFYVRNRGMLLDLSILCATVRVILFQEGAR
jgi:exopolysaccharide biosynthesis polyprenyl glycosylphosphotransferase